MKVHTRGDGPKRRPPAPNSPTVEVLFGGEPGGPDVGAVRVEVPVGAGMPAHTHGGSDIVLVPIEGAVEISKGDELVKVAVGDAILILKDEAVSLRNPGDQPAHVIVAAGPATFIAGVRAWPDAADA